MDKVSGPGRAKKYITAADTNESYSDDGIVGIGDFRGRSVFDFSVAGSVEKD